MTAIGSVFLGDVQRRQRLLSSSTPPSSPPPHKSSSAMSSLYELDFDLPDEKPPLTAPTIPPELSLDLRLRWLETLLHGSRPEGTKTVELKNGDTLSRRADEIHRRMDGIVQGNEGLRKFMEHCERNLCFPPGKQR